MDKTSLITLHWLDWVVIAIYGGICFGIAIWAMGKIKDTGGLLVGKRKCGPLMMMAASFAGGTNANHPLSTAAAAYSKGMPGVWLSLTWMLITPFFWLYPPAVRRLRIVTMVDVVRMRFGHFMAMIFKIVGILLGPVIMGFGIKSAAVLIEIMTGGAVSGIWAMLAIAVPTVIYSLMGGIIAAYATDVFQGLLIIVLSFLLIPFAIHSAGGVEQLNSNVGNEFANLFGGQGEFGFWWIFWFALGCLFSAATSAAGGAAAAKNEMASRMKLFGLVAKRFCTIGWGLVGVFGIALFAGYDVLNPEVGGSPDAVFPLAAGSLLPVVLRGILVASVLAAVMSSLDAGILQFGGTVVNNLYQEHFVKKASSKHYLFMARLFSAIGLALGLWVATWQINLVEFTTIVEPLGGLTGLAILVAIVWRRVTAAGAIASVFVVGPLFIAANGPTFPNYVSLDNSMPTRVEVHSIESFPDTKVLPNVIVALENGEEISGSTVGNKRSAAQWRVKAIQGGVTTTTTAANYIEFATQEDGSIDYGYLANFLPAPEGEELANMHAKLNAFNPALTESIAVPDDFEGDAAAFAAQYSFITVNTFSLFQAFQLQGTATWVGSLFDATKDLDNKHNKVTGEYTSLPVQVKYPLFLIPALLTMIIVSLFTKQHDQKSVDEFYCRLDTPVGDEHKIREAGFEVDQLEKLSETVDNDKQANPGRLLMVDMLYLPWLISSGKAKWSDYKWDMIGIVGSLAFIALFLWGTYALGMYLFHG